MPDQALSTMVRSWRVSADRAETRLDTFVRECLPHLSRRAVEVAIGDKLFTINNRIGKKGDQLLAGDQLTFRGASYWLLNAPVPQSHLRVPVVYEDDWVLVVDKPAGMATHGFSGCDQDTLANFLAAERPELLMVGRNRWEPGLVHRLDRETSGLILVAKTQVAFHDLQQQFRRRQVKKKYWALVWGVTAARGRIDYRIAHASHDKRRMQAIVQVSSLSRKQKSWAALTRFRKLWGGDGLSLLETEMETGVMHQIRVHLAGIGHPIVGDNLYGRVDRGKSILDRQFLHAFSLEFFHPENRRLVKIESELPVDLKDVLYRLQPVP
jgi:23S rRNA pseudouridine1911/1915/1917 synthase